MYKLKMAKIKQIFSEKERVRGRGLRIVKDKEWGWERLF
jgi:hypothetical protein